MRNVWKIRLSVVFGVALAAAMLVGGPQQADARPQNLKGFTLKYPALKAEATKAKCGICHPGKDKKERNAYGMAVQKGLTKKNEKDAEKIAKALGDAEKAKSGTEGKTFGDLIEDGKLPK